MSEKSMGEKKALPIGAEFFGEFQSENFYYVDKTGFISELMRIKGKVNLFTRPRRFGKSLNMDMLKSFFEIGADASLFKGLDIAKASGICEQHMGKYPVISISLKDVAGEDFQTAYDMMGVVISEEASRFDGLMESEILTQADKVKLQQVIEGNFEKKAFLYSSLKLLTRILSRHYGSSVIFLLDEYDVPLDQAYQNGYYKEMVQLIRLLFGQVFKTNPNLEFAVITGCLRIARESIFTGLNNFKVHTISDIGGSEYFGFTDREVREMLEYYGIEERYEDMKEWYDGYRFGDTEVYCPWDVINQCDKFIMNRDAHMESHWENSSSNSIIRDIIEDATETTKAELEALISGECIEKKLIPELTYADFGSEDRETRQDYLWSVLFATGYLTDAGKPAGRIHKLTIPNKEILGIYEERILSWFGRKIVSNTDRWQRFCMAVKEGDGESVQALLNSFMEESISIRDTYARKEMKENYYHGMLLGLLRVEENWIVKSNIESGVGYTDILIKIPSGKTGCVIEIKYAEKGAFDSACREAMRQIEDAGYADALKEDGIERIYKYGIACYKKTCKVVCAAE